MVYSYYSCHLSFHLAWTVCCYSHHHEESPCYRHSYTSTCDHAPDHSLALPSSSAQQASTLIWAGLLQPHVSRQSREVLSLRFTSPLNPANSALIDHFDAYKLLDGFMALTREASVSMDLLAIYNPAPGQRVNSAGFRGQARSFPEYAQ